MSTPFTLVVLALVSTTLAACAVAPGGPSPRTPVMPPIGAIFTQVKAPLSTNFDSTTLGSRRGTADSFFIREPFLGTSYAFGDASVETAAANANITTVRHVDYKMTTVLGLFGQFTVIVFGD